MPASAKSKIFIAILAVTLVGMVAVAGAVTWMFQRIDAPGPLVEDRIHVVPGGAGVSRIAADLEESGIIASRLLFRLYVRYRNADMKMRAGEYEFSAGASMAQVFDLLVAGKTVLHRVTVPEGLTSFEAVALLNAAEPLTGKAEIPAEGSILPETYTFARDQDRAEVVGHMQEAMSRTLAELWEGRADDLPIRTPEEAVILASIVEKETGIADERPRVAAVFVNRLRKRMRLQSDPTVIYALSDGRGRLDRELLLKDLEIDSPYNTYRVAGLPPGPICNPGRASLAAVLNPIESKELYFVADGTGGHVFAETLTEHERNVAKWRKIRREQRRRERQQQEQH